MREAQNWRSLISSNLLFINNLIFLFQIIAWIFLKVLVDIYNIISIYVWWNSFLLIFCFFPWNTYLKIDDTSLLFLFSMPLGIQNTDSSN